MRSGGTGRATFKLGETGVAGKPRLLVIDRDSSHEKSTLDCLSESFERVTVRTISKALALLRDQKFDAVYVDASQLSAVRWVGMMIQAEEILDAISDGVAVVDPDLRIIWANPEFHSLTDSSDAGGRLPFYQALGQAEILGPDPCPFTTAVASKAAASTAMKIAGDRYLRLTVTPVFDASNTLTHLIALTRETTDETQQQLKVNAIHEAGDELADLTPDELAEMAVEERTDLLKYNIAPAHEGPAGSGLHRDPAARPRDQPADPALDRGDDAAGGQSRALCPQGGQRRDRLRGGDRADLRLPRHDQRPALHRRGGRVAQLADGPPDHSRHGDRHAERREPAARTPSTTATASSSRSTAATSPRPSTRSSCLQAEKASTASASVEAINRELALPLDDIITDATTVLDRYAGHDEDIIARLRHLLYRAREIRSLIHKAGSTVVPQPKQAPPAPRLGWRARGSSSSTPTRPSADRPITCSAARGRASRPPATPTRRSPSCARPPIRPPWSTSACPTSTATRRSSGCAKSSPTCRSS